MMAEFGDTLDPDVGHELAWNCVLAVDALADDERPVRLARAAVASFSGKMKRFALNTLGAALYRAGDYEGAIVCLKESIAVHGGGGYPQDWAFLAMAHHRLGHVDESRQWMERLRKHEQSRATAFSWDEIEIEILGREVQAMLSRRSNATRREEPGHPLLNQTRHLSPPRPNCDRSIRLSIHSSPTSS
jgi:hypothetical protein